MFIVYDLVESLSVAEVKHCEVTYGVHVAEICFAPLGEYGYAVFDHGVLIVGSDAGDDLLFLLFGKVEVKQPGASVDLCSCGETERGGDTFKVVRTSRCVLSTQLVRPCSSAAASRALVAGRR